jgi:glucose-6-phosphate 1-epimerase
VEVRHTDGSNGLPKLMLSHPAGSRAEVYLQGAHVTSWIPDDGVERLFLSRAARFGPGTPIRGGVPVIFPQFADNGPLPKHGFARLHDWQWVENAAGPGVVLRLTDNEDTRVSWPHEFVAELRIELGAVDLSLALDITNAGSEPFAFTAALHTYFLLADSSRAAVAGLEGAAYLDKTDGWAELRQAAAELRVEGEVDRIYRHAPSEVRLLDSAAGQGVRIGSAGFEDIVVWNPGPELSAELPDFDAAEYRQMLCVEAAQARQPVVLQPGAAWSGRQHLAALSIARGG